MAGQRPSFITGANAKLKIAGVTLAYAGDVDINTSVQHIPVEAFGRYEPHSNEPVSYDVSGSFSVIRYTKRAKDSAIEKVSDNGNAPTEIEATQFGEHMNPKNMLLSETFDMEIFQKHSNAAGSAVEDTQVFKVTDGRIIRRSGGLVKRGILVDRFDFVGRLASDTDLPVAEIVASSGQQDNS